MLKAFTLTLIYAEDNIYQPPGIIEAETHALAAEEMMMHWVASGHVSILQMPIDVIVHDAEGLAQRFRCEAPPAFLTLELTCCRFCGWTDDYRVDPEFSWSSVGLCNNPACLEKAGRG